MSMHRFHPLDDRVLIDRAMDQVSKSGKLVIPVDVLKTKSQEGIVVAVGPGHRTEDGKLQPMRVGVGHRVWFGTYSGMGCEIAIDDKEYVVLRESEILGVVEEVNGPDGRTTEDCVRS